MMKFTKKEISLCKQVAERHRKPIKKGDWIYWHDMGAIELIDEEDYTPMHKKSWFPLWTLSDCLEFLRKKGWFLWGLIELQDEKGFEINITEAIENNWYIFDQMEDEEEHSKSVIGKTPLEACLKAVLAVLEENSK